MSKVRPISDTFTSLWGPQGGPQVMLMLSGDPLSFLGQAANTGVILSQLQLTSLPLTGSLEEVDIHTHRQTHRGVQHTQTYTHTTSVVMTS